MVMDEKQYNPARTNTPSPAPGMAAVNTHAPGEEPQVREEGEGANRLNSGEQERQAQEGEREGN
jgi:hypothetical protein